MRTVDSHGSKAYASALQESGTPRALLSYPPVVQPAQGHRPASGKTGGLLCAGRAVRVVAFGFGVDSVGVEASPTVLTRMRVRVASFVVVISYSWPLYRSTQRGCSQAARVAFKWGDEMEGAALCCGSVFRREALRAASDEARTIRGNAPRVD
jgi:hypothetical protein